jgi:hypothetical protein
MKGVASVSEVRIRRADDIVGRKLKRAQLEWCGMIFTYVS